MATENFKTSLKKGDQVVVISGKDKGKHGEILQVIPSKSAVLVDKINMIKRHTRATKEQQGGIIEKEGPIHISNVMLRDPDTGKGVRIGKKFLEDGRKVRIACGSGEVMDRR